ncbi:unnamed protein product [Rotaria sp. Silwood2]|nr:unnamed protein product [Rotaria sp. Silwood2]CAF4475274.1 unnamed protein product [Rotaria sp. Silwood2]
MSLLNIFTFNISSSSDLDNQIDLPSNEGIPYTFREFKNNRIISYIHFFSKTKEEQCHIFTYPYKLKHYHNITNNFSSELFKYVREISLYDERPFEHESFIRIQQSFPSVKTYL